MLKPDLIRLIIFSLLLIFVILLYANIGLFNFTNVNTDNELPEPRENIIYNNVSEISTGSVEDAKKSNLTFELVGIRGNNPESTIIIYSDSKYKLIEQGYNVTPQIVFSHIEGSRAYFFDGSEYTYLDIIGTDRAFNSQKIKK